METEEMINLCAAYGFYSRLLYDKKTLRIYIPKRKKTHRWIDWNFTKQITKLFRDGFYDRLEHRKDLEDLLLLAKSIRK